MLDTRPQSPWAGVPYLPEVTQDDIAPIGAPPSVFAPMPPAAPNLPAPVMPTASLAPPKPNPFDLAPVAQTAQDRLAKDVWHDQNPWGTANNHPGIGGKIAHVLSTAGQIAGSIFAPAVLENIPGTSLNRARDEAINRGIIRTAGQEAADEKEKDARTAQLQEETTEAPGKAADTHKVADATAEHLGAETDALENPKPAIHDTPMGLMMVDPKAGTATPVTAHGVPIGPKLKTSVVNGVIGQDGQPHSFMVDEHGTKIADLGKHYERPVTVNVAAERSAKNDVLKAYQPTLDSAERMNVMTESYEKAIKDHDQQAMLNLLANHLGMTMGLQKGARITKDLYQEAAHSTPWLSSARAKFDKDGYLAGVTLNPNQMRQMVQLGQSRYAEDTKKSRATAQYLGANDDGPVRVPGKATINYYLGLANGDPAKAKSLAAQDGWSIQ